MNEPRIPMPQALYDEFGVEVTDKVQDFVRQHVLADRELRAAPEVRAEVEPEVLKRYAAWASEFAAQHGHPPTAAEVYQTITAGVTAARIVRHVDLPATLPPGQIEAAPGVTAALAPLSGDQMRKLWSESGEPGNFTGDFIPMVRRIERALGVQGTLKEQPR